MRKKEVILLKCCRTNWIDKKKPQQIVAADKAHQAIYPGFTEKYNSLIFCLMGYWYVDRRRFGFWFQRVLENKDVCSAGFLGRAASTGAFFSFYRSHELCWCLFDLVTCIVWESGPTPAVPSCSSSYVWMAGSESETCSLRRVRGAASDLFTLFGLRELMHLWVWCDWMS